MTLVKSTNFSALRSRGYQNAMPSPFDSQFQIRLHFPMDVTIFGVHYDTTGTWIIRPMTLPLHIDVDHR